MLNIQGLREQRASLAREVKDLLDKNTGDKWKANPANQTDYDERIAKIEALDDEISRISRLAELAADEAFGNEIVKHAEKTGNRKLAADDPRSVFNTFMRVGFDGASAEDRLRIRNVMSTTTNSEGGFTVPSLIASQIIDQMKAYGTMRAVAESIPTSDGKPLSYPGSDGTSETGEWIAQNVTATAADPTFTSVSLNVFKASSKIIAVPIELLQDSVIDMEAFLRRRIAQRLGRLGNTAFTVGTGTTQPDGIVPRATSGKVGATGQTVTIVYDDVVDLIHSVDPAYRAPGCAFMAPDALVRVIRKLKDTSGRPLWMPSYDAGISRAVNPAAHGGFTAQDQAVVFDYLMGYPLWVNNDMASPAANAKTLIFGDFSYYKIRDAMDMLLFRFTDSNYARLGQVAFLAWARMGGNLVDTSSVKFYAHSAT